MYAMPFDPTLARQVKADSLEPHQQATERGFKTATDFRQRYMIKHPFLSEFHSYAEYLHAALLEGDPTVTSYVPQPFRLMIGKRRYKPDCYVLSDNQPIQIIELKPRGEMANELKIPLMHFFSQYKMVFEVISNESVLEREVEAVNWLDIIQTLYRARDLITEEQEQTILGTFYEKGNSSLGDIIDPGDRERTFYDEVALFRLLHRGLLKAELTKTPLDYNTEFDLCA